MTFKNMLDKRELRDIQGHFHALILSRAEELIREHNVTLPELSDPLPLSEKKGWFAVPGMYGGFSFWFVADDSRAKLIVESWSRVVHGSGQRHEITTRGSTLTDRGFV